MSHRMKVRFVRPWRNYRAGQVIEPFSGQARMMIKRGIVEAVVAPVASAPAGAVTMTPPVEMEVTVADEPRKKKGRN